jgi:8-oxo-dGTP pyrophosphatase MutT (NUDIX family)
MDPFAHVIDAIIREQIEPKFESSVAIVKCRDRWLLGMSRNSGKRSGKWCHPGGHIKRNENPKQAAERECYEETGIRCKAVGDPFRMNGHKGIAFVPCRAAANQKIDVNSEFSAAGFFTMDEIRNLKPLYENVKDLIKKARKAER